MREPRWSAIGGAILVLAGLLLSGCAETPVSAAGTDSGPATVEPIEDSEVSRVTLTEQAIVRLDLRTAPVIEDEVSTDRGSGALVNRKIIPYGAVIYDNVGATWAYTAPEPGVFIRAPITIAYVDGDRAVLVEGPSVGTEVVTLGAAELYGAELGLGQ